MVKYILLASAVLMLFSSCNKEPVQNFNKVVVTALSKKDHDTHFNEYYPHTNGDFYIWTECYIIPKPSVGITYPNNLLLSGEFYNKQSDTIPINGGVVIVDTLHTYPSINYYYNYKDNYDSNLYGKNVTINLTPPSSQAPPFALQMYMPKQIFAYMGKTTLANATYYLQNHSDTLYWNADPNNTNGIEIGSAIATNYNGTTVIGQTYLNGIPDNGMYVLPKSFYADFASGTSITFIVGRRTYALATYNQYKYLIDAYCYTPVFSWIVP